ncbi:MAG TPA: monothiol bacilliredoxin BrxC family protein [Gemmatimonadales bacterium]|nr:monothiol bacilliredoxin BrxC family protein [Gemmatimonadales bacterium]
MTTPEDVDLFLREHPLAAILKLGRCHKNDAALAIVTPAMAARPDVGFALLHVVECRAASNHVAALTGIVHESPQLVLFRDGRAQFDRDNWDITPEDVVEGLSALQQEMVEAG